MRGELPARLATRPSTGWSRRSIGKAETIATRKASQNALNHLGPALPELLGGSADLTGSNLTDFKGCGALRAGGRRVRCRGRHINYGVREFGMSAIMNGVALHGGFIPYGGTFLTFSDYCAQRAAHGGADEAARDLRVHARLDRPGRGRPDAPVGRARREPAPDPGHGRLASGRSGRIGSRLGRGDRARRRPEHAAVLAPGGALRDALRRAGRRDPARCLRAARRRGGRWP